MHAMLDIVNLAITKLEIAETLQSLDANTPIASRAKAHWPNALECVLREHPWGFATRRARLALLAEKPDGHEYAYAYPQDCVMARRLLSCGGEREFHIENLAESKRKAIVSDAEDASLVYTTNGVDVADFTPHFAEALSWRLAAEMSLAQQASIERYQAAIQTYAMVLGQAAAWDAREGRKCLDHDGPWIKARR